jgi:transcription antitermination factor NusA-like protein
MNHDETSKNLLRTTDARERLAMATRHVMLVTGDFADMIGSGHKLTHAESLELRGQLVDIMEWVNSARRRVLDMTKGAEETSLEAKERREGLDYRQWVVGHDQEKL